MIRALVLLLVACGTPGPPAPDAAPPEDPLRRVAPPDSDATTPASPCGIVVDPLTHIALPCKPYDVRTDLGMPLP